MKIIIKGFIVIAILISLNQKSFSQEESEDTIVTIVEVAPKFPGGETARINFLKQNIEYPELAREQGIQGTVYVTFVIRNDGSLSDIGILRGIGGGCDEEVIRVIKLMPKWEPGYQRGKAVNVQFNMPMKFTLEGNRKKKEKKKKRRIWKN
ncbi:energy transducer TonB [Bacteroidota bacterium]